jgi:uncharacterized SAM-binding protein YcdF (DUF218 family)
MIMSVVSLFLLCLGIFSIRVRTRRYIINVAAILFVWQLIILLIGPGVMVRKLIDSESAASPNTFVSGVNAIYDAMMSAGLVTALSLVAWPFLLAAAMRLRER